MIVDRQIIQNKNYRIREKNEVNNELNSNRKSQVYPSTENSASNLKLELNNV